MQFKKFSLKAAYLDTVFESNKLNYFCPEKRYTVRIKQKRTITIIKLDDINAEVTQKKIKNLHLRVCPPAGHVCISAPFRMNQEKIRVFALSKLDWIRKQQQRMSNQVCELPDKYIDQETHYFRGNSYQLKVLEYNCSPFAELIGKEIFLHVPLGTDTKKKRAVLNEWYRLQLMESIPPLVKKWEIKLNVSVERFSIREMKSRWGSCSSKTRRIRFNLELAKKTPECLEYIVVHELVHLLEASHNSRFKALMNQFYPNWKYYWKELLSLPKKV